MSMANEQCWHLKVEDVLFDQVVLAQCYNRSADSVEVRVMNGIFVAGCRVRRLHTYITTTNKLLVISTRHALFQLRV